MDNSNLELFKQAINEGLSNKIDSITNSCSEEIVYSEKHKIAMRTIVHGKIGRKSATSLKVRRIIAILVAAALLLTSCGIIFRNEIREIFEDLFVKATYNDEMSEGEKIDEVYTLTYLPQGYSLEKEKVVPLRVSYIFINGNDDIIKFEQRSLEGVHFNFDSESGYSKILEINKYDVYYRFTNTYHCYIWNDGTYSMRLNSSIPLSKTDIVLILDGIAKK